MSRPQIAAAGRDELCGEVCASLAIRFVELQPYFVVIAENMRVGDEGDLVEFLVIGSSVRQKSVDESGSDPGAFAWIITSANADDGVKEV